MKIQQSGKLMWMFIDRVSILSGHRVTFYTFMFIVQTEILEY